MKRFFVLPLLLIFFCSCSKSEQVAPIIDNISFTAYIKYDQEEYVCDSTMSNGSLNIVVKEPDEIKDFILSVDKNGAQANFKGIDFKPDLYSLPQGAVAQVLFDVFDDVKEKKMIKCNQENCVIENTINDNKYEFVFSPTGLPLSLKIENIDFEIEFKNVTML